MRAYIYLDAMIPLFKKAHVPDRLTAAGIALLYAIFAALWIVSSGYLLTHTVTAPVLRGRLELAKGLMFVTVTSSLLYLLLKGWRESNDSAIVVQEGGMDVPKTTRLVLPFIALALVVPLIGLAIFKIHAPQTEQDTYRDLEAVAKLKATQIENWMSERHGDGTVLAANKPFATLIDRFVHQQYDHNLSIHILDQFAALRVAYGYDSILLLNTSGHALIASGEITDTLPAQQSLLHQSQVSREVLRSDLYRDKTGHPYMDWMVPIVTSDSRGEHAVAVVVLRTMPDQFLFPLIQTWPADSASAETLLVRREGKSIIYLNELRFRKKTALTLTLPLSDLELPSAIAVRATKPGTVQGVDYRGVQVLAAYRPVVGTDWDIVAKVDRDEVMGPVWSMVYWITLVAFAAVVLIMGALLRLWRQQRRTYQLELQLRSAAMVEESEERYRAVMQTANDAIITADSTGNLMKWNASAEHMFGYSEAEVSGRALTMLMPERYREQHSMGLTRVAAGGLAHIIGKTVELAGQRKDGSEFPMELSLAQWRTAKGWFCAAIIRDITERAQEAKKLVASELRYRRLFESDKDGILILNAETGMIEDVNPFLSKILGFSKDKFLGKKIWELGLFKNILASQEHYAELQQKGYLRYEDMPLEAADGQVFPVEFICNSYWVGQLKVFQCNIRDISERKAAEAKIHRLTQLYAALSQCNQAIVRCANEAALFPQICRDAVEFGGFKMAWIGLINETNKLVTPVASYGDGTEYLVGLQVSLNNDSSIGCSITRTAICENQPSWCQDFQHDPLTEQWHDRGTRFGWGSAASLPLHRNGVLIGAFTLYSGAVNAFDEEARKLLGEMAMDISFALHNFAREAERMQAALIVAQSEQRFRSLVEQSISGIYIIQDGKLAYVNPRFTDIFGFGSCDELIGVDPLTLVAEQDRGIVAENLCQRLEGELQSINYEFTALRKDGSQIVVGVHGARATHGGRPAVIGMIQNVSEKKRAEEQALRYVEQLNNAFMHTVEVATNLIELRDPYTAGHENRVGQLAVAIGADLGFDAQHQEGLRIGGYLHDIGKITVPAEILAKSGKLSSAEYTLIKSHPQAGYDVLKNVDFPWPVADIVYQHHEHMDGSGYPRGLKGDEIRLEARIMTVADVVEAMSSHRPYRQGVGIEGALAEIEHGRGTLYDPQVVDSCLRLFREKSYRLSR